MLRPTSQELADCPSNGNPPGSILGVQGGINDKLKIITYEDKSKEGVKKRGHE